MYSKCQIDPSAGLLLANEWKGVDSLKFHTSRPHKSWIPYEKHTSNFFMRPSFKNMIACFMYSNLIVNIINLTKAKLWPLSTVITSTHATKMIWSSKGELHQLQCQSLLPWDHFLYWSLRPGMFYHWPVRRLLIWLLRLFRFILIINEARLWVKTKKLKKSVLSYHSSP